LIITAEDTKQTLNDLKQWLKTNAPTYFTQKLEESKGAQESDFKYIFTTLGLTEASASYIPLKILYSLFDGGFQL